MSYTSIDKIVNLTGVDESVIQQEWLDWADAEIDKETQCKFGVSSSSTLKLDGNGLDCLYIPEGPIIEITQIVIKDGTTTYTYNSDDISNYFAIYNNESIIQFKEDVTTGDINTFPKGQQNIEITGKFGYSYIPDLVEELATLLVIRIMLLRYPQLQVDSERIGDYSVSYKKNGFDLDATIDELFELIKQHYKTTTSVIT